MANRKSGKDTSVQGSGHANGSMWESGACKGEEDTPLACIIPSAPLPQAIPTTTMHKLLTWCIGAWFPDTTIFIGSALTLVHSTKGDHLP